MRRAGGGRTRCRRQVLGFESAHESPGLAGVGSVARYWRRAEGPGSRWGQAEGVPRTTECKAGSLRSWFGRRCVPLSCLAPELVTSATLLWPRPWVHPPLVPPMRERSGLRGRAPHAFSCSGLRLCLVALFPAVRPLTRPLQLVLSGSPAAWLMLRVCPMELEGKMPIFRECWTRCHWYWVGCQPGAVWVPLLTV